MNDKLQSLLRGKNTAYLLGLAGVGVVLLLVYQHMSATQIPQDILPYTPVSVRAENQPSHTSVLEERLAEILSAMAEVGQVQVMITLAQGPELVVATEVNRSEATTTEDDGQGGTRGVSNRSEQTSYVTLGNGNQPLVLTEREARVEGVIVVAEGADNIRVVEAITQGVRALLGIEAHRVVVLNMGS